MQALDEQVKEVASLRRLRAEYEQLQVTLRNLPSKVEHDVMVPLCKNAFMPGKLRHTNEILVLLGDDTYAERSASQAAEIAARRTEHVAHRLAAAEREAATLERKHESALGMQRAAEGSAEDEIVDICEPYESDDEAPSGAARSAPVASVVSAGAARGVRPPGLRAGEVSGSTGSQPGPAAAPPPAQPSVGASDAADAAERPVSKFKAARMRARGPPSGSGE